MPITGWGLMLAAHCAATLAPNREDLGKELLLGKGLALLRLPTVRVWLHNFILQGSCIVVVCGCI